MAPSEGGSSYAQASPRDGGGGAGRPAGQTGEVQQFDGVDDEVDGVDNKVHGDDKVDGGDEVDGDNEINGVDGGNGVDGVVGDDRGDHSEGDHGKK